LVDTLVPRLSAQRYAVSRVVGIEMRAATVPDPVLEHSTVLLRGSIWIELNIGFLRSLGSASHIATVFANREFLA
jgi:hypothetical protein